MNQSGLTTSNRTRLKVSVELPEDDVDRVSAIALRRGTTRSAALVRAIRIAFYLEEAAHAGSKIVIVDQDSNQTEIIFS